MHRVNLRFVPLFAVFLGATSWIVGCPNTSECQSLIDCPSGKVCSTEGKCVPAPDVGEGEGEPGDAGFPGEGEGEGDAGVPLEEVLIQLTSAPPTMLLPDPFTGPGNALLATGALAEDRVSRFSIAADNPTFTTVRDFLLVSPQPNSCRLDSIGVFDASFLELPDDEIWWSCKTPAAVRIEYSSDPQAVQLFDDPALDAFEVSYHYASTDDPNYLGRVAFAARDGALQIQRFAVGDQARVARQFEDTSTLGLEHVAGIWPIITNDTQLGDILLVYDRGEDAAEQRLVPIQRRYSQTTWSTTLVATAVSFHEIALPDETHYALFLSDVGIRDPLGFSLEDSDNDAANVVLFLPTLGEVRFLRYEVEAITPGSQTFRPLLVQGTRPAENPDPTDRVLLSTYRAGARTYFFYALTNEPRAWRLPMHENRQADRTNEVMGTLTERADEYYAGMIPIDALDAWFAGTASGQYFLRRMAFSISGL